MQTTAFERLVPPAPLGVLPGALPIWPRPARRTRRVAVAWVLPWALLLVACGSDGVEGTQPPGGGGSRTDEASGGVAEGGDEVDDVSGDVSEASSEGEGPPVVAPVTLRVVNDTAEPVTLERSFGPTEPFAIGRMDTMLHPRVELDERDDAQSGDWVRTCECACGEDACPECEPPPSVQVRLAPGEPYEARWSGRLRRWRDRDGGSCYDLFTPPAGRYVFSACTTESGCARAEVRLPARDAIEIRLGERSRVPSCGALAAGAARRAAGRTLDAVGRVLRDRPVDACPRIPRCAEPDELDAALEGVRSERCSVFVVPRGDELEAMVFLPLPEGHVGGERYSNFYDPDATRRLRARYEQ